MTSSRPVRPLGDIGSALERADASAVVGWIGFAVGWGITYLLGRHAVHRLAALTHDGEALVPQLRAMGLFAWLLGAAVVIVVSIGLLSAGGVGATAVAFEALGLVASGIFLVLVRLFMPLAERAPRHGVLPNSGRRDRAGDRGGTGPSTDTRRRRQPVTYVLRQRPSSGPCCRPGCGDAYGDPVIRPAVIDIAESTREEGQHCAFAA